jgi:outer membrane protein TolC
MHLGYLLGRDAGAMVEPDGDLSDHPPLQVPTRVNLLGRPELAALQSAVAAAQHEADAAAAQRMPAVDTFARYQIDKGWRRSGDGSSWTAGIAVSVPLFDGQAIRNDIAAAKAHEREASEQLRRARMALHLAYQEAKLAYELTRKQHEVALKMVDHATEAAELSRQRYAAGTLLSTELIGVESRLINARVQLAVATAQQQISLAKLRRAAGLPIL